jgi:hypothetical protein
MEEELPAEVRRFLENSRAALKDFEARWEMDVGQLGEVLRAHLVVEHFMTMFLASMNPRLGSLSGARLSFSQKVALLDRTDERIRHLAAGIVHMNKIRNKFVHQLDYKVTDADVRPLCENKSFRDATELAHKTAGATVPDTPIGVFRMFGIIAAGAFQGAVFRGFGDALTPPVEGTAEGRRPE